MQSGSSFGRTGILSGRAIREEVEAKRISIEPFSEDQLQPASYDLRLGSTYRTYEMLDVRVLRSDAPNPTSEIVPFERVILQPGVGYLMHTAERIRTDCYVPFIDGKSSIGRLFVQVHATAGRGDPGFDGQYTLEVIALYPTLLVADMLVAQVSFLTIVPDSANEIDLYEGNYRAQTASGPVPSKSWNQK